MRPGGGGEKWFTFLGLITLTKVILVLSCLGYLPLCLFCSVHFPGKGSWEHWRVGDCPHQPPGRVWYQLRLTFTFLGLISQATTSPFLYFPPKGSGFQGFPPYDSNLGLAVAQCVGGSRMGLSLFVLHRKDQQAKQSLSRHAPAPEG